ncbi:MAG: DUF4278 domain-containing protein, partial [Microcystaceae cyanobacterium]
VDSQFFTVSKPFKSCLKFTSEANYMKLSYRGVSHEVELSLLEMNEGEVGGKYRGQNWRYHYPRHIPQLQTKSYRQYRGVVYNNRLISDTEIPSISNSKISKATCAVPVKKTGAVFGNEITKTHLENIRRNLEYRLQIAKASGDKNLINLLEEESQQLTLNL